MLTNRKVLESSFVVNWLACTFKQTLNRPLHVLIKSTGAYFALKHVSFNSVSLMM